MRVKRAAAIKKGALPAAKPTRPLRPAKGRSLPPARSGEWHAGQEAGYRLGWSHGYHMGRCKKVVSSIPQERGILWNLKVLYVKADGAPYAAMDIGIADALRKLVREVIVVNPSDDVVGIAQRSRPDLVLVLDAIGQSFPPHKAGAIRESGIRTAIWLPDDPYHSDQTIQIVPHYDYVFTLEMSCVDVYRSLGCPNVHYLPFGINPDTIKLDYVSTSYRKDICFIGSAFWNRVAFMDEMADYLQDKNVLINGYWWDRMKSYQKLASKIQGYWLSPEETAKYYAGSKIVINLHRSIDDESHNSNSRQIPAFSPNPRLFDISACGTLQLTDVRQELANLYTPGEELDTFSTPRELMEKLDYYLSHEEERQRVALKGLSRTLRQHTYRSRLHELLTIASGSTP